MTNDKSLLTIDIFAGLSLLYFIHKIILPALFGKIALELTNEGIIDNINNRLIKWDNIKAVRKVRFRAGSWGVAIDLHNESELDKQLNLLQKGLCYVTNIFYGTPLTMAFQYIEGDSATIFLAIHNKFRSKNNS